MHKWNGGVCQGQHSRRIPYPVWLATADRRPHVDDACLLPPSPLLAAVGLMLVWKMLAEGMRGRLRL